jgi:Protein of unknown function (DUF3159)
MSSGSDAAEPDRVSVEALVRERLSAALGGKRGMLEGALPTLGFTITWVLSHHLRLSLAVSLGIALAFLVARVVQRSTVQFVLNALVAIAIAAVFALRSGRAEDAFLPGLIYNSAYAVGLSLSALVRWPLVGFLIGGVIGDPVGWHRDRRLVSICSKLTWVLAAPCVLRVVVQYPLWAGHHAGWLGVAKLAMGWPLQIAALAVMAWLLGRDKSAVVVSRPPSPEPVGEASG